MTDSQKSDILVLGATGFTGKLVTRYLAAHPQRSHFSFAVGARSVKKLDAVVKDLNLASSVKLIQVDVTKQDELERAVKGTRVVINTVGPYWNWGTPVVRACARNGVHYVDLTGERHWLMKIIREFDYLATKTGAIIVPSCGFDSIPSDVSVYLANKTLKSIPSSGEHIGVGTSTSAHKFNGGISGGTIASVISTIEDVPRHVTKESHKPYSLSPVVGIARPPFRFIYNLAIPGARTLKGALFVMGPVNTALVQRTFGLFELQAAQNKDKESKLKRYGPGFSYEEFMVVPSAFSALLFTTALIFSFSMLMITPFRAIAKRFLPQSGDGPSDEKMQKGFFNVTNITTSASSPPIQVKTVIKGNGDPGYLLTAIMISESALIFVLPPVSESAKIKGTLGQNSNIHALAPFVRQGGVLTPMVAFGDILIQRLEESGRFEFSSSVVGDEKGKKFV